jgi:hypothetical protein
LFSHGLVFLVGLTVAGALSGVADAGQVTLAWTPSSDPRVAGYNIYYGHASRNYQTKIDVGNRSTQTLTELNSPEAYYIAATAYDRYGLESDFSAEVTWINTDQPDDVIVAINAGGDRYVDKSGIVYAADTMYSRGEIFSTSQVIAGTEDDLLYQTSRNGNFSYSVPVENGFYLVVLKFAEIFWNERGRRVFDVLVEGEELLVDIDIFARVGSFGAYDVEFPVRVSDGMLNLDFRNDLDGAAVGAIVVKASPDPSSSVVFAVNAGGEEYLAPSGVTYLADTFYVGGGTYRSSQVVGATEETALHQSGRMGSFSYAIPLANGEYRLTLKCSETLTVGDGQRVFDVLVEGKELVADLDLHAEAGFAQAYEIQLPVTVTDRMLDVTFRKNVRQAVVSGLVVELLD